jgi:hypothetical protein
LIIEPLQHSDDAIRDQLNDMGVDKQTQISNNQKADVEELFIPDGITLPYYVLVNSNEGSDYLINILSIETNGIKITYRKLSADESKLLRLPEKSKE